MALRPAALLGSRRDRRHREQQEGIHRLHGPLWSADLRGLRHQERTPDALFREHRALPDGRPTPAIGWLLRANHHRAIRRWLRRAFRSCLQGYPARGGDRHGACADVGPGRAFLLRPQGSEGSRGRRKPRGPPAGRGRSGLDRGGCDDGGNVDRGNGPEVACRGRHPSRGPRGLGRPDGARLGRPRRPRRDRPYMGDADPCHRHHRRDHERPARP